MIPTLDRIPLMIYDERENPKSSKEVTVRLRSCLSRKLGTAISALMLAVHEDWLAPVTVFSQGDPVVGYELTPSIGLIDALIKCEIVGVLQEVAVIVFALRKPIDEKVSSFVSTMNWAKQYVQTHLPNSASVLNYLLDYCPEIAYFISASKDIGAEKAARNLLTRDATAQCWVDDVWRAQ